MKRNLLFFSWLVVFILLISCNDGAYKYESVPNDPLKTRIYTLGNGLKIYLSVNKDKPRVQTYIGVRVGAKNDPAETTGLAHYFEHLMFKGTSSFGTSNYEAEKPLLDQIEALFEKYRTVKDVAERKAMYAQIDSLSQEAAKLAIPNEYDKLMSAIGSQGTNAFTSYDITAYVENIPSNEIDNWATIQADRFKDPVIRLFHTELETVYEEYNMGLASDGRKVYTSLLGMLFPHHPYGTQTVLGTQDHLKNPSIINIKKYFDTYYVPNNMAVCMVGDFDPDEVVAIIDKHFGKMERKDFPELKVAPEVPIQQPIVKEVVGLEAANVSIAFRLPAANTKEAATLEFMDYLMTNGKAGLIDLNLVQKQKALYAGSSPVLMSDYSMFYLYGTPKEGQTLEEVRDLLLGQIDLLKKGEFDDSLLEAVINNFKAEQYYQAQEPGYAAYLLLNSFMNNSDWKDEVNKIDFQSKLTKKDIVDFSNKYFNNNYAIVYKRQGKPEDNKIEKPQITPIPTNRDSESTFLASIKGREVKPIEPVFLDYSKDLSKLTIKSNIALLYKQNNTNPLFSLSYVFEMGNDNDKALGTAFRYLNYLGTSKQTAEEIKSELYRLACTFDVSSTNDRVYVSVKGLNENFEKTLALLESRLSDAQVDLAAYNNLSSDILKSRVDAKANQGANFSRLSNYAMWGPKSSATNILLEAELKALNPQELVDRIKGLKNYQHTILYYGPLSADQITESLNKNHAVAEELKPIPAATKFTQQDATEALVLVANYDAKQIYLAMLHKGGGFDKTIEPIRSMYNSYFGGGMNSIVFQEMREARALAYSAWAGYTDPVKIDEAYYLNTFIATQNDKMFDAIAAFNEILDTIPQSDKAFGIAKESIVTNIRTERILREGVLWNYLNAQKFGYDTDARKVIFDQVPNFTLADVVAFQEKYVKDKPKTYVILGDVKELNMKELNKIGKVKILKQEEIFGY